VASHLLDPTRLAVRLSLLILTISILTAGLSFLLPLRVQLWWPQLVRDAMPDTWAAIRLGALVCAVGLLTGGAAELVIRVERERALEILDASGSVAN
jgi:hypothetical protein